MPLLSADDKGTAQHICSTCGREREIKKTEWIVNKEDPEECVFVSPKCPGCGTFEAFVYHDWIYASSRTKTVPVIDVSFAPGPIPLPFATKRIVVDPVTREKKEATQTETETFMDAEHFGAQQMVLIETIAVALKRKKAKRSNGEMSYDKAPKAPDPEKVRAVVGNAKGASRGLA